jgi:hypothetical protein
MIGNRQRHPGAVIIVLGLIVMFPKSAARAAPQQSDAGEAAGTSASKLKCELPTTDANSKHSDALAARVEELSRQVEVLRRMVASLMARTGDESLAATATSQQLEMVAPEHGPAAELAAENPVSASVVAPQSKANAAETPSSPFGPFRLSGDFRLRLDGIFRSAYHATAPGESSLAHVQNVRGRYRFRLNLDAEINRSVSFHAQLATGPANNPLTLDQDFAATISRHPFLLNEAWIDIHPGKGLTLQGGRVQEIFADNLRFLFDDDIAFNGFNERLSHEFEKQVLGFRRIELRAGQYLLSHPNIAVVTAGNLGAAGAVLGSTGRAAQMFHQGLILEQSLSPRSSQQLGADIQAYRNPNQIQFASTAAGIPIIIQNNLGIALSGPLPGTGNATTASGGAIYSARSFQVAHLTYRFDYTGFRSGRQEYPLTFNLQAARNIGTGQLERDALLANIKIGRIANRWDHSLLYSFAIKGANSMISQLTDDDLGTSSGVNIRSHFFRFDLGLAKGFQVQSLLFIQNELRNSGQFPGFFVPLNAYTPRQFRFQEQVVFTF